MARPTAGIKWKPHTMGGQEYDLAHLHPHDEIYVIPAGPAGDELRLSMHVSYGMHCFTRKQVDNEFVASDGWYSDSREVRIFCPHRWQLSLMVPEIIATLDRRRCLHTGREEFVTIEIVENGERFDYAVFFTVTKGGKSGADLNLFVNSAHRRYNELRYTKPIAFKVIALNRYKGKKIKPPR